MSIKIGDSFYTGRKIRKEIALEQVAQETPKVTPKEVSKVEHKVVTATNTALTFINWNKDHTNVNNLSDEVSEQNYQRLISFFESSFRKHPIRIEFNPNYMIGVFGTFSHVVIDNARKRAKENIRYLKNDWTTFQDIHFLRATNYSNCNDIYACCASSLYEFINSYCRDDFIRHSSMFLLESLAVIKDVPALTEGKSLWHLSICQRVLETFKEMPGVRNVKFVWNVEFSLSELGEALLNNLSSLATDNFIIAFNCPAKFRVESDPTGLKQLIGLERKTDGTYSFSNLHFLDRYQSRIFSSD